jgi:DNA-binding GntR family transcriptional regulator
MNPGDLPPDLFSPWEGAVAFRLFADQTDPTLTVSEQIAARWATASCRGHGAGRAHRRAGTGRRVRVSRGPIREALRILEREGLATLLPRRGAIVTELSADELRELLEIRAGLFEMVVRKIAAQPNARVAGHAGRRCGAAGSPGPDPDAGNDYAETTYRLLILCARQCGNQRLQRMLTALSLQTLRYSKLGLATVARRQRRPLWREATVALAHGDVERMVALTRQRIEESGEEAIRSLKLPNTPRRGP